MSMVNAAAEIARLERLLQTKMLGLPLVGTVRLARQRLVLAWDGLRVYWVKPLQSLPPPTVTELEEAISGLQEDVAEALTRLYVPPVPAPAAKP